MLDLKKTEPASSVSLYALSRSALQSWPFAHDSKSWKATSGNSRRSAPKTDAVEPFVHLDGILAHALANDIERYLVVGKGAADDARENGKGVIAREFVTGEVEPLACEAISILEDANGDCPDVCEGYLRERACRRQRRRVDPFGELLFHEIEVLHEGDGRKNRGPDADFRDVLFNLVFAVEVRSAGLPVGVADGGKDEMNACCLGCVGGDNTLSSYGVDTPPDGTVIAKRDVAPSRAFVIVAVSSGAAGTSIAPAFASDFA